MENNAIFRPQVFLAHSPDGTTNAKKLQNSHLNNYHYP